MKASRETQQISEKVPAPVIICLLDSTPGVEWGEWPADSRVEERVWHIFCDKEKVVGSSLIRLLRMRVCNKGLLNRHITVEISSPDAITKQEWSMLPLTVEQLQHTTLNHRRPLAQGLNVNRLKTRCGFVRVYKCDRSWKTDTVDGRSNEDDYRGVYSIL